MYNHVQVSRKTKVRTLQNEEYRTVQNRQDRIILYLNRILEIRVFELRDKDEISRKTIAAKF